MRFLYRYRRSAWPSIILSLVAPPCSYCHFPRNTSRTTLRFLDSLLLPPPAAERMSLTVFVAHTGQRLLVEPASYSSFEAFKSWLSRISAIPDPSQVLLLASGKQAKFQSLFTDVSTVLPSWSFTG